MIGLLKRQNERREPAKAVAENFSRPPVNANNSLKTYTTPVNAMSAAADVRLALAGRLVTMLPRLPEDKQSQLYAYTVQALGTIALEEVLKIRHALSTTLKDHAFTPPKMAAQLSLLLEQSISEPILRFCASASNEDLADILRAHPAPWAERVIISEDGKHSASSENLQKIVVKSRELKEWQVPTPTNIALPPSMARELSEFVDAAVREILMTEGKFDRRTTEDVTSVFRRRLNRIKGDSSSHVIDDDAITDALALRDTVFVFQGLAKRLGVEKNSIVEIFEARSAKSIVALCWKAGLTMRTALALQKDLGLVSAARLIYPKGGTDYPFTEGEMRWQLEFLGIVKS